LKHEYGLGPLRVRGLAKVALHADLTTLALCVIKGKWRLALIDAFLWLLSYFAAFRLAKPHSLWARKLYGRAKMHRAACPLRRSTVEIRARGHDRLTARPRFANRFAKPS
jgi:hypothetical protein